MNLLSQALGAYLMQQRATVLSLTNSPKLTEQLLDELRAELNGSPSLPAQIDHQLQLRLQEDFPHEKPDARLGR